MQKQDEVYQKVAQIEKEIWYLVKNRLPKLKQEILETEKLKDMDKKIGQIQQNVGSINLAVDILNTNLQALQQTVGNMSGTEQDLADIHESLDKNSKDLADAVAQLQQLHKSTTENSENISLTIARIVDVEQSNTDLQKQLSAAQTASSKNAEDIQKNSSAISTNTLAIQNNSGLISSNTETIQSVSAQVDKNKGDISSLNTEVENISSSVQSLTTSVNENTTKIQENNTLAQSAVSSSEQTSQSLKTVTSKVEELEKRPQRAIDVLFDMSSEDENVNKGFSSGLITNKKITWETDYETVRIYASLSNYFSYLEIPLSNRLKNDIALFAANPTGKNLYCLKGSINPDGKQLTVGRYNVYTLDTTTGTVSVAALTDGTGFISRIEGIRYQ